MVDEVESHSAAVDIATAVWAGELSCSRRTPRRSFPRRLLFNASRHLHRLSAKYAPLTVEPFDMICHYHTFTAPKTVAMTFPADGVTLNFLGVGELACF